MSFYSRMMELPKDILIEMLSKQIPAVTITTKEIPDVDCFDNSAQFALEIKYPDGSIFTHDFSVRLEDLLAFLRPDVPDKHRTCGHYMHGYYGEYLFFFRKDRLCLDMSHGILGLSSGVEAEILKQLNNIAEDWTAHPEKYPIKIPYVDHSDEEAENQAE